MLWMNWVLMAFCGGLVVVGVLALKNGRTFRPVLTIAAAMVFVMALVATFKGISVEELRYRIEGRAPTTEQTAESAP